MLTILIVNWNVRELLGACLRSIERFPSTQHRQRIVVVDNASSDGSADFVRTNFPDVHLIANATNRGFTGGNNDGLRAIEQQWSRDRLSRPGSARNGSPISQYVFLLNPDTEVTAGALDGLLAYADAHPDVGVVGPQLRSPDGGVQSSRRRFPTLTTALFESTWLQPIAPRHVLDRYYARECGDDQTCEVDWVVGAAMLVRAEPVERVGGLDERNFFMYSEELDWCKRFKDAGWKVMYYPGAQVIHHEARSSSQISARRMIYFNTSKVRYVAKHRGKGEAAIVRAALLGMFAWQWSLEGAKRVLGSRPALRAERMRAYAGVLRSGLR
jgi:GT2 family glycosyltransferase